MDYLLIRMRSLRNSNNLINKVHERFGAKLISNWEQNMLYNRSLQILCIKKISMLTGGRKYHPSHLNVYFIEQNIMRRWTPWD